MSFDVNLKLLPILKRIPLFNDLNEKDHKEIIKNIDTRFFRSGHIIFNEGDDSDALFIIEKGRVLIYREDSDGHDKEVAKLSKGKFFGEMGLVATQKRNASAKALEDSVLFVIIRDDFQKLLTENEQLAEQISRTFLARYNENLTSCIN